MHKKLEADLISLAHSILQMKNKDNVFLLKQKSKEIYEKLSVLAFVEEYVNSTPSLKQTKTELLETVDKAFALKEEVLKVQTEPNKKELKPEQHKEENVVYNLVDESKEVQKEENKKAIKSDDEKPKQNLNKEIIEQPFDELEGIMFSKEIPPKSVEDEVNSEEVPEIKSEEIPEKKLEEALKKEKEMLKEVQHKKETLTNLEQESDVVKVEVRKTMSLEEELQDIVSVDFMADLFEKAPSKSLNDRLSGNIQIGLNDRIAFVKNLFNGNQEDYNRVVSQLNTFKSETEAKNFINSMVKPDYNWSEKEELETRFMEIIERKFS